MVDPPPVSAAAIASHGGNGAWRDGGEPITMGSNPKPKERSASKSVLDGRTAARKGAGNANTGNANTGGTAAAESNMSGLRQLLLDTFEGVFWDMCKILTFIWYGIVWITKCIWSWVKWLVYFSIIVCFIFYAMMFIWSNVICPQIKYPDLLAGICPSPSSQQPPVSKPIPTNTIEDPRFEDYIAITYEDVFGAESSISIVPNYEARRLGFEHQIEWWVDLSPKFHALNKETQSYLSREKTQLLMTPALAECYPNKGNNTIRQIKVRIESLYNHIEDYVEKLRQLQHFSMVSHSQYAVATSPENLHPERCDFDWWEVISRWGCSTQKAQVREAYVAFLRQSITLFHELRELADEAKQIHHSMHRSGFRLFKDTVAQAPKEKACLERVLLREAQQSLDTKSLIAKIMAYAFSLGRAPQPQLLPDDIALLQRRDTLLEKVDRLASTVIPHSEFMKNLLDQEGVNLEQSVQYISEANLALIMNGTVSPLQHAKMMQRIVNSNTAQEIQMHRRWAEWQRSQEHTTVTDATETP